MASTPHIAFSSGERNRDDMMDSAVGRGSAIESFRLFAYDLRDYEEIFKDKLELFIGRR